MALLPSIPIVLTAVLLLWVVCVCVCVCVFVCVWCVCVVLVSMLFCSLPCRYKADGTPKFFQFGFEPAAADGSPNGTAGATKTPGSKKKTRRQGTASRRSRRTNKGSRHGPHGGSQSQPNLRRARTAGAGMRRPRRHKGKAGRGHRAMGSRVGGGSGGDGVDKAATWSGSPSSSRGAGSVKLPRIGSSQGQRAPAGGGDAGGGDAATGGQGSDGRFSPIVVHASDPSGAVRGGDEEDGGVGVGDATQQQPTSEQQGSDESVADDVSSYTTASASVV